MADDEELNIEMSDQVRKQMEKDPKLAAALREMLANFRQAHAGVKSGQYPSFDEAMFQITGNRPERIVDDE